MSWLTWCSLLMVIFTTVTFAPDLFSYNLSWVGVLTSARDNGSKAQQCLHCGASKRARPKTEALVFFSQQRCSFDLVSLSAPNTLAQTEISQQLLEGSFLHTPIDPRWGMSLTLANPPPFSLQNETIIWGQEPVTSFSKRRQRRYKHWSY